MGQGRQAKLVAQEAVFVGQAAEVIVLPLLGRGLRIEQTGLSEEEGFDLEGVVAMLADGAERYVERPAFKGLSVDAKAKVARQGDETTALPIAIGQSQIVVDARLLLFQALGGQGGQPRGALQRRQIGQDAEARRIFFFCKEGGIIGLHVSRHLELELRNALAVLRQRESVRLTHNVKHDIIIMRIAIVAVVKPIRGAVVDLHIAGPIGGTNLHFRIEEIGAIMGIGKANVDYFNALAALRRQRTQGKEAMTPYVVKQLLHKGVHIWLICQRYGFWAGRTRYWLHFLAS